MEMRGIDYSQLPSGRLSQAPDHAFSLDELYPYITVYCQAYGFESEVLAAIVYRESTWTNWVVHKDGTGHGLVGLDDNGLLPGFEVWVRRNKGVENQWYYVGRGSSASPIPPEWQLEYAAMMLAMMKRKYGGSTYSAVREWHCGPRINTSDGINYENLIRKHVKEFFG